MGLQNLFKLIRKEDVALWIGAGFSMYAGYPSGLKIKELIYEELTNEEKNEISANNSLRDIAEGFVNFRGGSRNELNLILKKEFGKAPQATHLHEMLSRVPHFKSIITTNYDSLIEESYTRRANVIRYDRDVPYIDSFKPAIYKPHGDLESLDNIIITKTDYNKFRKFNLTTPIWISILDILSKKSLFFLGYSFEDENVWSWLDLIDKHIKENRKQRFLIAPNWPDTKILELEKRHIEYINMSADSFLQELTQMLKLNIIGDLENGLISQDTFNEFFNLQSIDTQINSIDGKPTLIGLSKSGKIIPPKINFKIANKKTANSLKNFNDGIGKSIIINADELSHFEVFMDDFRLNFNPETVRSFKIIRLSTKHKVTIEFPDEDILIEDITFEVYRKSKRLTKIESNYYGFKANLLLTFNSAKSGFDITATFVGPDKFPSMPKCILFHKMLVNLATGKKAIFHFNEKIIDTLNPILNSDLAKLEDALNFFIKLRKIEKAFKASFEGAAIDFSKEKSKIVDTLCDLIDQKYLKVNHEAGVTIYCEQPNQIEDLPNNFNSILFKSGENKTIRLYDRDINLGEIGLEITNAEYIEFSSDRTKAIAKSKIGEYKERYSAIFPFDSVVNIG